MKDRSFIKFLGTAGARFVVARQLRSSAGTFLRLKGKSIILDPGPGCLVRCARSRPPVDVAALDALILSHAHIDHTNDANVLIDAMTWGGLRKRGVLFAPEECLRGEHRVILRYLEGFLERIEVLKPATRYHLGELSFMTSPRLRHPAETYGFIFTVNGRRLSFVTDTKYFPGLIDAYRKSDLLVMNVVRHAPFADPGVMHLSLDDVREIVTRVKPRKAILTHLGMTMLRSNPCPLSRELTEELNVETVIASDGMAEHLP